MHKNTLHFQRAAGAPPCPYLWAPMCIFQCVWSSYCTFLLLTDSKHRGCFFSTAIFQSSIYMHYMTYRL